MRKFILLSALSLILFTSCHKENLPGGEWIDLTYDFSPETIYWPTAEGFELMTVFKGPTEKGYYYYSNNYTASEHGGTHIDAPNHFADRRKTVDQIDLEQLIGNAVVIDVSDRALNDRDYQVGIADFKNWEQEHGRIEDGAIILLNTGYGRFWPDREKYMGTAETGADAVQDLHFPGLDPDAARWLVDNRNINAIGLDTPSIDYGQSKYYKSHQILFESNIPAFENVSNIDKLPPTGAIVFAFPMKIKDGSGAPLRIVALIPGKR